MWSICHFIGGLLIYVLVLVVVGLLLLIMLILHRFRGSCGISVMLHNRIFVQLWLLCNVAVFLLLV